MPIGPGTAGIVERAAGLVARLSLGVAAALLVAIFLLVNAEIAARYLAGTSLLVADEFSGYAFAALVFLGLNHALHHGRMITVEMPGRLGRLAGHPAARLAAAVCGLVLNLTLAWSVWLTVGTSIRFQSRSIQVSKTLLALPQSVVLAGLVLLCLASAALVFALSRRPR
ncbi:MAG: TRAP transporter small permease [Alphaproteobacteria bacterium]